MNNHNQKEDLEKKDIKERIYKNKMLKFFMGFNSGHYSAPRRGQETKRPLLPDWQEPQTDPEAYRGGGGLLNRNRHKTFRVRVY